MRIFFDEHVRVLLLFFCYTENGSLRPTRLRYYNIPTIL